MKTHNWFLVIAVVLVGYVLWRGGDDRFSSRRQLNYDTVAISDGLSAKALELDLQRDLDPALLPELGREAIRAAAQKGLKEQAFLEDMIRGISNRVREISTIDLNGDDVVDPILVTPEPSQEEGYVLLSLQVPAPGAYPLPPAADTAAWKKVETFEVASMTVALDEKALTVQASPNQHVYPNAGQNNYVVRDSQPSFLQTYLAIRMTQWMFFPGMYGFMGPGYGYGYYRAAPVASVASQRGAAVSNRGYAGSKASATPAIKSRSGAAPTSRYGRATAAAQPRSLSQLKSSSSFKRQQATRAVRSGGFGRSGAAAGSAVSRSAPTARRPASAFGRSSFSRQSSSGFGRGASRSGFGGGGMRFGK